MNISKNKLGFTLMETMIVVLVIGILATAGIPYYRDHLERQKLALGITDLRMIADSVERYMALHPNSLSINFSLLDINIGDNDDSYDNSYFTFSLSHAPDYVLGDRNTGEYSLHFILGDNPELCCVNNTNSDICADKLNLSICQAQVSQEQEEEQ